MLREVKGWVATVAALAALGLTGASPASAQAIEGAVDRAISLESEAQALSEQKHRWDYAASLYRAAAQLREEGDPQAVHDLEWAAKLAYYTRDLDAAMDDLERAALHALAGGDVMRAAHIYTDAAWVAGKAGKTRDQRALAARAQRLTDSPLLGEGEREAVLDRFDEALQEAVSNLQQQQP